MAGSRLRDRFFVPRVARAMTSPLAIVAAGAGAAVGIVALGPLAAVPGALLAWACRVAAAVPRRAASPEVAPRRLAQPWRSYVERAQASEQRFVATVALAPPGPVRERLRAIGERVGAGVVESWEIAQRGQLLSEARRGVDVAGIAGELGALRGPRGDAAGGVGGRPDGSAGAQAAAATIEALEAQLASARRLDGLIADADAQLRLLDARMAEAVTRAVELTAPSASTDDLGPLGDDVDSAVGEMEALRQALDEVRRAGTLPSP